MFSKKSSRKPLKKKSLFFLASHRSDLSPSSRVCAHLVSVWRRGYRSNETGGAGAVRNGPLFANSLSAALEMRDAYRSFQLEPFVSNRKKLRASALTKCSLVLLKTNTCLNFNQVSDTRTRSSFPTLATALFVRSDQRQINTKLGDFFGLTWD